MALVVHERYTNQCLIIKELEEMLCSDVDVNEVPFFKTLRQPCPLEG